MTLFWTQSVEMSCSRVWKFKRHSPTRKAAKKLFNLLYDALSDASLVPIMALWNWDWEPEDEDLLPKYKTKKALYSRHTGRDAFFVATVVFDRYVELSLLSTKFPYATIYTPFRHFALELKDWLEVSSVDGADPELYGEVEKSSTVPCQNSGCCVKMFHGKRRYTFIKCMGTVPKHCNEFCSPRCTLNYVLGEDLPYQTYVILVHGYDLYEYEYHQEITD